MTRRANQSPGARERERIATRERMRRYREDPDYRAAASARRKARDAERKLSDPDLRARLRANSKRYFEKRKGDPEFWKPRKEYRRRWLAERRENEEFEVFMLRMEREAQEQE